MTTSAILVWLAAWAILHARWRKKTVAPVHIKIALALLALALLLTFPPFADLL